MYTDRAKYCVALILLSASSVTSNETPDKFVQNETSMVHIHVTAEMINQAKTNPVTSNEISGNCGQSENRMAYLHIATEMISQAKTSSVTSNEISGNCGQSENRMVYLDIATEMISKFKNSNDTSAKYNYKETSMAYMDAIIEMVSKVKNNLPAFDSCCNFKHSAADCADLFQMGHTKSGVYTISPINRLFNKNLLEVYCDMETDGGAWTLIQRRGNFGNPKDYFYRNWTSYKQGFGHLEKEFWLGNDNIFALTNQRLYSVRFDLEGGDEKSKGYAQYDTFWIDDENQKYTLHISNYSGNAGDSLIQRHNKRKFSTIDQDNDSFKRNCAEDYKGAWWYSDCYLSNLNGKNHKNEKVATGIVWSSWRPESLAWTEIKLRPKDFQSYNSPTVTV